MMTHRFYALLLSSVFLLGTPALQAADAPASPAAKAAEQAATPVKGPNPESIPALASIKKTGADLEYDYLGHRDGFHVWLVSGQGRMQVVYTHDVTGAAIVSGVFLGPDGQEALAGLQRQFTEQQPERAKAILLRAQQPGPGQKEAGKATTEPAATTKAGDRALALWQQLDGLGRVTYGPVENTAIPVVYAVLDSAQPESGQAWNRLIALADAGKIVFHVIPLSITSADNIMVIAQVLGSDDPAAAWREVMAGKLDNLPATPGPKGPEGLQANVTFAQSLKLRDLPFLIYRRTADDGAVRAVKGVPKDWQKLWADLGVSPDAPPATPPSAPAAPPNTP